MQMFQTSSLNYVEKEIVQYSVMVTFFRAVNSAGQDIYVFYALNGAYLDAFNLLLKKGMLDDERLRRYGKVLAHGIGEPDEFTLRRMEREYHFNLAVLDTPDALPRVMELA